MQSQIITIRLDYGSDFQEESRSEYFDLSLKALCEMMRSRHQDNKCCYSIKDIDWIEGVYEGKMKYRRYEGMNIQQFYDENMKEIDKYMKNSERKRSLSIMFDDIREGD